MTQSNASCKCSGYNTPNGNTVYTKKQKKQKIFIAEVGMHFFLDELSRSALFEKNICVNTIALIMYYLLIVVRAIADFTSPLPYSLLFLIYDE